MANKTTWTQFGPDVPKTSLPGDFQACLPPNSSSDLCDDTVGSASTGLGYCANDLYKQMTYCACVNNAVKCPEVNMPACMNSAYAYKPKIWYDPGPNGTPSQYEQCKREPTCINVLDVGGSQNVAADIQQNCGAAEKAYHILQNNPYLAALLFILIISLIIVLSITPEGAAQGAAQDTSPKK